MIEFAFNGLRNEMGWEGKGVDGFLFGNYHLLAVPFNNQQILLKPNEGEISPPFKIRNRVLGKKW